MTASISHLNDVRFDRAVAELHELDRRARVALDADTGLVKGVDGSFELELTTSVRALGHSDRAAAVAVLFLDRLGAAFGLAGWHVLTPESASPLGSTIWFTFAAPTEHGDVRLHVCVDGHRVTHVRVEQALEGDADRDDDADAQLHGETGDTPERSNREPVTIIR